MSAGCALPSASPIPSCPQQSRRGKCRGAMRRSHRKNTEPNDLEGEGDKSREARKQHGPRKGHCGRSYRFLRICRSLGRASRVCAWSATVQIRGRADCCIHTRRKRHRTRLPEITEQESGAEIAGDCGSKCVDEIKSRDRSSHAAGTQDQVLNQKGQCCSHQHRWNEQQEKAEQSRESKICSRRERGRPVEDA